MTEDNNFSVKFKSLFLTSISLKVSKTFISFEPSHLWENVVKEVTLTAAKISQLIKQTQQNQVTDTNRTTIY